MIESDISTRRVVLVDSVHGGGMVLERALASRGWTVIRIEPDCRLAPDSINDSDVVLLDLDDDDADVFEWLLALSGLQRRPTVVLMTRRADAYVLGDEVLDSLGIDRVASWPARIEQIEAVLEAARRERQPERAVS